MAGGLLFGIALFRAGVLARWAAVLLAVGTVVTVASRCCRTPSTGRWPSPTASR